MKKMKKVLAMILSLVMVFAMSLTAFAADPDTDPGTGDSGTKTEIPQASNTTLATVNKVESNATVTAYQIVKAKYKMNGDVSEGFIGYEAVSGVALADPLKPTSDEITTIAADKTFLEAATTNKVTMIKGTEAADGTASFTAQLNPGYWVVIVSETDSQTIYNPMLVGVWYSKSGSEDVMSTEPVGADEEWDLDTENVYAKSDKPTFDKKITGSTTENGTDNTDAAKEDVALNGTDGKGNDVAIGDTVKYQINALIPAYSDSYTSVKVQISDQLSKGLKLKGTPVVTVNKTKIEDPKGVYTYTPVNRKEEGKTDQVEGYTITFDSAYALAHTGEEIVVTYEAELTEDAATNFDPNTNTAKYTYSNDPMDEESVEEIEKKTYTYTFEIDGKLYGNNEGDWNKVTEELLKGKKVTTTETGKWKDFGPLGGAVFTLTNDVTGVSYEATTTDDGRMNFKGLDAGTYTLVEKTAPEGYTLNTQTVPVVITATYNTDGTLKDYSIKVNNKETSTYEATYDKSDASTAKDVVTNITTKEEITTKEGYTTSDAYIFWNTELSSLPSTGGIGTTIFTIGGCIIMIIAAGLFFASRRKKAEN